MPWRKTLRIPRHRIHLNTSKRQRHFSSSNRVVLEPVLELKSWDVDSFRSQVFQPSIPAKLPIQRAELPPACSKWFVHDDNPSVNISQHTPICSTLNETFWDPHSPLQVSLELTGPSPSNSEETTFHRTEAPLYLLLAHLSSTSPKPEHRIYLAQCPLASLPPALLSDIPTPALVLKAGKGDIYDSSLWLGLAPTYTPLHRDPNPNLLFQLAGTKQIRLYPPQVGLAIFKCIQEALQRGSSPMFRGDEMMAGPEKEALERFIWSAEFVEDNERTALQRCGYEVSIGLGEAVFIPKGWWHSVKGIGEGVVASVNWWFR